MRNRSHIPRLVSLVSGLLVSLMLAGNALAGTISASASAASASVDLTAEGISDWVHWGRDSLDSVDRKAGTAARIGPVTPLGTLGGFASSSAGSVYRWSDGTPLAVATGTGTAWRTRAAVGEGYRFTVPAGTSSHSLKLFLGLNSVKVRVGATLSDASAPAAIVILDQQTGKSTHAVSLDFAADSDGQALTITVTIEEVYPSKYNWIALESAALSGVDSGPVVPMTGTPVILPGGGTFSNPTSVSLTSSTDGAIIYYSTDGSVPDEASYTYAAPFTLTESATVRALALKDGLQPSEIAAASFTIDSNPAGGEGLIDVSGEAAATSIDLTTSGPADWVHWGTTDLQSLDRKRQVTPLISDFSLIGHPVVFAHDSASSDYSWSDGTPTLSARGIARGIRLPDDVGTGFRLSVPVGTSPLTFKIYVGLNNARARVTAALSDNSAPPSETLLDGPDGRATQVATINAQAATAGQTLVVDIVLDAVYPARRNWIMLEAAALDAAPPDTTPATAAPTFSPAGGSFTDSIAVTLASATAGATIHYTTDGSMPTTASAIYSAPFTLTTTTTVRALATSPNRTDSLESSATFNRSVTPAPVAAAPLFSPAAGTYTETVNITLTSATASAAIHYTTDGSTPDSSDTLYSGTFSLSSDSTVKAIALADGYQVSPVTSAGYVIQPAAPAGGTLSGSLATTASRVDLTASGSLDWAHWGRLSATSMDRKAGVTPRISNYTRTGGARIFASASSGAGYGWTDGTPLTSMYSDKRGLRLKAPIGGGFRFTVPADTSLKTLTVHVGALRASGRLRASLSDGSAPDFETEVSLPSSRGSRTVTVDFRAASAGQTLTIDYQLAATFGSTPNWISLEAASLAGSELTLPYSEDFSSGRAPGWQIVDEAGTASTWAAQTRALRQTNSMGFYGGAVSGGYHLGTYAYLTAATGMRDYRFRADVTPLSATAEDVGAMIRVAPGAASYIRLSSSAAGGFTRLEQRRAGSFTTLASNARGVLSGATVNFDLEASGPIVIARQDGVKLFGAYDANATAGAVGLYCRDACAFDNVRLDEPGTAPVIAMAAPVAWSVLPATDFVATAVVLNKPSGASVEFSIGGLACDSAAETAPGRFSAQCQAPAAGVYEMTVTLHDGTAVVDTHVIDHVGIGDQFIGLGDSITYGVDDNTATDGVSNDGWIVSSQGYRARLVDRLNDGQTFPTLVQNAGVPGDTSAKTLNERLNDRLEQFPDANRAIVVLGVNDSSGTLFTPSGLGCSGSACNGTFKGNMQGIINRLRDANVTPVVASTPPRFGDPFQAPYAHPETHTRNLLIRDGYNAVIAAELSGAEPGPDFYDYFLGSENRFYLYASNLHPNALGYAVMAQLLDNSLRGIDTPPFIATRLCLRKTAGANCTSPLPYKQNLLESGDAYLVDKSFALTGKIPATLSDGRWILTADADRNASNSDYLSFNVPSGSTLFVAYDAAATSLPAWLGNYYSDSGLRLSTSNPAVPVMRLYRRLNVSGNVELGGAAASTHGAGSNYLVVVVQN